MTYRIRNISLAVVLALVAALLTTFYVSNYKRNVQRGEGNVTVLVASRDIPAGMPGKEAVAKNLLAARELPRRSVVPGAVSSPDQIAKLVATEQTLVGEQVTTRRFGPMSETGVRTQLKGNVRAFQLPGDANQLLAGTLRAGDRVDVVATWTYPEGSQQHVTRVVLRDLTVLRVSGSDEASAKITSAPGASHWAMLALTDSQSQRLVWATRNGEWALTLRAPRESADSPDRVDTSESLVAAGIPHGRIRPMLHPLGGR